jgi:GTPase SAR1 family protein
MGCFFFFDLTNLKSFNNLEKWVRLLDDFENGVHKVLIGTKSDLEDKREVDGFMIENFSKTYDLQYFEISIKKDHSNYKNIKMAWKYLCNEIVSDEEKMRELNFKKLEIPLLKTKTSDNVLEETKESWFSCSIL